MKTPKIIGIVGASGSGKTTLARELVKTLGDCCLVSQDHYYRNLPDGVEASDWNFDDPTAIDLAHLARDLTELKLGKTIEGPRYVFAEHRRAPDTIKLDPSPVIVVEGLFLSTTAELRDVFDIKVFVDEEPAVCLERRIARDVVKRGRTEAEIRRRWEEQVEPMFKRYVEPTRAVADAVLGKKTPNIKERVAHLVRLLKNLN